MTPTRRSKLPVAVAVARGDLSALAPVGDELTSQAAADVLNVSREYVIRLLDEKRIPFRKIGRHRRLRVEDVLAFKEQSDADRQAGLCELTRLSQELGGYDVEET